MSKMKEKTIYVVHAIDTEGPLYESIRANFERIEEIYGHKLECSQENLLKLQRGEVELNGDEEIIKRVLSGKRIETYKSWTEIDKMLDIITSQEYRNKLQDSYGEGWIYNWFCMSHVGFTGNNPRRRDIGYHNIFDHYKEYFDLKKDDNDLIEWHYHPLSITNDAHRAGSTYLNSSHIFNILSRMIIDRSWFPSVYRAGHNTERPDSNFFLEQWIPFDFSNASQGFDESDDSVTYSRFGDWRRAPVSWIPYHPSHDDYQTIGECRRYIARCLSIDDRSYSINQEDVNKAFQEADKFGSSILSFTHHDFRDMDVDIQMIRTMLMNSSKEYPEVKFKYSNAIDAMRGVFNLNSDVINGLEVRIEDKRSHKKIIVEASDEIFGPQPYLAIKTFANDYYWQNFDFDTKKSWSYSFDVNNIEIEHIAAIGVATNYPSGITEVINVDPKTGSIKKKTLNAF